MTKHKLTKNLGLKVMAFIFSALLWLIVVNVDDPVKQKTFSDISVSFVNEDVITQQGNVYQVLDGSTVTAVVSARRSVLQEISSEDIIATADIKEMDTDTGLVPVKISVANMTAGEDYQTAEAVPNNLRIRVEKSGKKVLSLTASTDGVTMRDGYVIGSTTVSPERVTITGAESRIEEIDRAVAYVHSASGISEDSDLAADLILYDKDNNILDQNQLSNNLGEKGLTVHIEVLESKSVALNFEVSGTPAEGYQYVGVTSEPESIEVYGSEEVLDQIDSIDIPDSVINIEGASANVEASVDITSYLPEGVSLGEGTTGTVVVTALIEEEGMRTINFLVSSVRINNLSENLQVSYEPDAEVSLQFRGDQKQLDILDVRNAVSVDLRSYTEPGTYQVPVNVIVPDGITFVEGAAVTLTLSEKTDSSETDSGTDSRQDTDSQSGSAEQQENPDQQEEEE
ncbi:hypothetical protein H6B11_12075 [Mediterraneibacter glycyrrhizinilyticus]|nr:CdaR family protein [Mediterraneibacter glycyrrhizinilyticus]MBM6854877.1 hypothetical protein [Mediterraneibacter glycyrrhizinilyticus]